LRGFKQTDEKEGYGETSKEYKDLDYWIKPLLKTNHEEREREPPKKKGILLVSKGLFCARRSNLNYLGVPRSFMRSKLSRTKCRNRGRKGGKNEKWEGHSSDVGTKTEV